LHFALCTCLYLLWDFDPLWTNLGR
jgi:hypothetical protein